MLNTNASCVVKNQTGFDLYGQPAWGAGVTEPCAIVRLKPIVQHTTVRADGSMSRGHGDERVMTLKVQLAATTVAQLGSIVELAINGRSYSFKITSMEPRVDVLGPVDHYEVEGEQCP